jgi:hypothetical protein
MPDVEHIDQLGFLLNAVYNPIDMRLAAVKQVPEALILMRHRASAWTVS